MAVGEEERRQIAVHAGKKRKLEKGFAPVKLDPASGVGAAIGEHFVTNEVGETRCRFARAWSLAARPDPCGHGRLQAWAPEPAGETHDVGRIVLAVSVHGGDDRKSRGQNARPERGTLSGSLPMPEIAQQRVRAEQRLNFSPRSVVAPVIDGEHLAERGFRHFGEGFLDQRADIAFLVERGNDNGNTH